METLSIELCEHIFKLACNGSDAGVTARALSLVSRAVRNASRPFLYNSVIVKGPGQIAALEQRLADLPPRHRRIRSLFIAEDPSRPPLPSDRTLTWSRLSISSDSVVRLLSLAAPTVATLALVTRLIWNTENIFQHLFSLDLPNLRSLAIMGDYSLFELRRTVREDIALHRTPWLRTPKLERLHIAFGDCSGLFELDGGLAASCPHLTHLWVSQISYSSLFLEELHQASLGRPSGSMFGMPNLPARSSSIALVTPALRPHIPDSLRLIVLQPSPGPKCIKCASPSMHAGTQYAEMLRIWRVVVKSSQGGPCEYSLLPACDNAGIRAEILDNWIASVDGEDGHWANINKTSLPRDTAGRANN